MRSSRNRPMLPDGIRRLVRRGGDMTKRTILMLLASTSLLAQVDLSGSWAARNYGDALGVNPGPGPLPVEYFGLPLNEGPCACVALRCFASVKPGSHLRPLLLHICSDGAAGP